MAGTIVIGFDDSDGAARALDRAIDEAQSSGDTLVVVAVLEMLFDPEGPQNYAAWEMPAMMPLVEPPGSSLSSRRRVRDRRHESRSGLRLGSREPRGQDRFDGTRSRRSDGRLAASHHGFFGRMFGTDSAAEVERELGTGVVVVVD